MIDPITASPDIWDKIFNLGGIGILAGGTIWLLNKTWKDHVEVIKAYHEQERGRVDMLVGVVRENSSNTAKNNTLLDALHRRLDRLDREEFERSQGEK